MVCRPGDPCYSLTGKVITGRSVPGYDVIQNPSVIGSDPARSNLAIMNGATNVKMAGSDVGGNRPYGVPKTEAQRQATHSAKYGSTQLPPRGTGLARNNFISPGRGLPVQPQKMEISWGQVLGGALLGLIFGYFVFAQSGRDIGYAAGQRAARKIRG